MIWLPKCFNISDQFICADFTNKTICCMRICQRTNCVVKLNKIVLTSVNPDIVLVHNYYFCGFLKLFFFFFSFGICCWSLIMSLFTTAIHISLRILIFFPSQNQAHFPSFSFTDFQLILLQQFFLRISPTIRLLEFLFYIYFFFFLPAAHAT